MACVFTSSGARGSIFDDLHCQDLAEIGLRRVRLIADPWIRLFPPVAEQPLAENGFDYFLCDGVHVDPTEVYIRDAIDFAHGIEPGALVAVVVGSTIRTAKAVNLYTCHPIEDFVDYVKPPICRARPASRIAVQKMNRDHHLLVGPTPISH